MKKLKLLLAAPLLLFVCSFSSDNLPKDVSVLLAEAQMTLDIPDGYTPVKPVENRQMNYEYAIINKDRTFEVRYAIRPLDRMIADYNEREKNKKAGDINIHPNKLYTALTEATILNTSGGNMREPAVFDSAAVKSEFNADWGATTMYEVGEEFGQKYKYCMIVALHKDNAADAYYFYLAYDKNVITQNMDAAFHSLKFK